MAGLHALMSAYAVPLPDLSTCLSPHGSVARRSWTGWSLIPRIEALLVRMECYWLLPQEAKERSPTGVPELLNHLTEFESSPLAVTTS